ncbi:MAG: methionyl aminopeptidase [Ruminococcus sp.]|nr:methionyl aminopeptidase [Ruminococcus sp.]
MEKLGRNDACWCGSGKKYKKCHIDFDERIEEIESEGHIVPDHSIIKTPAQIEKIKESAKINIAVLDYVAEHIKAGISTAEIDKWVYDITTKMGGIPAPLNYQGFPKSVCTSINNEVCHGIPDENRILKDGDIINVDCSTELNGYFSDSSRMFCIGNVSEENKRLVEVAKQSLYEGLKEVKPWGFLGDMAEAVSKYVSENGYSIVREIGGHGIGLEFHEDPWVGYVTSGVSKFVAEKGHEMLLVPGMMFTIEPMINMGRQEIYTDDKNGWTIYTKDGKPSAQWEIQVLITDDGYEIISY